MLTCRKCLEPADSVRREFGNEIVQWIYQHNQYGKPPIEHKYNVLAYLADELIREDREREKEPD